ncbi:MAG: hypothetical protein NTV05_12370 [Acidobacteria bacterium]|nr:hypothetical protein [Acidobacteriota bacterium]
MCANGSHRNNDCEEERRIEALKQRAEQLSRGNMVSWMSDAVSLEQQEQFWRRVVEFDEAAGPTTTNFQQLVAAGVELPAPDLVDDEKLTGVLWAVVQGLALLNVFLTNTDHLSDRDLYGALWHRVLRDEVPALPDVPGSAWHVDLVGTGSEEDIRLYLRYYADEDCRRQWVVDFPDYDVPAHEDPPYDRDGHLPQPHYPGLVW